MTRYSACPAPRAVRLTPVALGVHLAIGALCAMGNAQADEAADAAAAAAANGGIQQVRIVGQADSGYKVKQTSTATKTDTLVRDTPQAITVVTKELMQDQGMQSMADVIRYVPGVVTAQGEGNRDTAVFRGNSSTGDFFIDGIRDDVQYFRDIYNIDSVEALKGSNAMIFGRGGSGGVINRVSKQPVWHDVRAASLTLGSWNNRRLTADVGQAINSVAAIRVNGVYENSDSYRNGVHIERAGINPTVALRAGANTRVVLGYEHFKDNRVADRGVPSWNGKPFDTDPSTFFGSAELSNADVRMDAFSATVEHELGSGALLRNRTRYADYDKFYQNVFPGKVNAAGTKVAVGAYNNATQRTNLFNQTDLTFSLNTGNIRHKFATGLEFGRQVTDNLRQTGTFPPTPNNVPFQVDTANPIVTVPVAFSSSTSDANNHGTATVASVYLQDQIEFSPQWQAIVGVRYDRFKVDFLDKRVNAATGTTTATRITDSPVSPRVGLVYKPIEAVSIYGSYSLAYVPRAGEQLSSLTPDNKVFDPEEFKNLELGVKWDVSPRLAATVALYQLDRKNVVITDPNDSTGKTSILLPDGQRTKGVELELSGMLSQNWSVMGGYAYQDARLTATQSKTVHAGAIVAQVPKHTVSLWNRYNVNDVWAVAAGLVYRDRIYPSSDNTVTVPGFTRVDGAVFYKVNKKVTVQLNIENLFDKKYYASAHTNDNITPGSPRAVHLGINATF
jgi:catecholate siderophore receptor